MGTVGYSRAAKTLRYEYGNEVGWIRRRRWMAIRMPYGQFAYCPVRPGQYCEILPSIMVDLIGCSSRLEQPMVQF